MPLGPTCAAASPASPPLPAVVADVALDLSLLVVGAAAARLCRRPATGAPAVGAAVAGLAAPAPPVPGTRVPTRLIGTWLVAGAAQRLLAPAWRHDVLNVMAACLAGLAALPPAAVGAPPTLVPATLPKSAVVAWLAARAAGPLAATRVGPAAAEQATWAVFGVAVGLLFLQHVVGDRVATGSLGGRDALLLAAAVGGAAVLVGAAAGVLYA